MAISGIILGSGPYWHANCSKPNVVKKLIPRRGFFAGKAFVVEIGQIAGMGGL